MAPESSAGFTRRVIERYIEPTIEKAVAERQGRGWRWTETRGLTVFAQILTTLDGSEYAERALSYARGLAMLEPARVSLLMVVPSETSAETAVDTASDVTRGESALAYLEEHASALRGAGVADVATQVRHGEPALAIAEAARGLTADLIVMSSQGLGADGRDALGSVALNVLMSAPCPIFLVRINKPAPPRSTAEERWQDEGGANVS